MNVLTIPPAFAAWRTAARRALVEERSPDELAWEETGLDAPALDLFEETAIAAPTGKAPRVPRA